jgi:hypothetical protein
VAEGIRGAKDGQARRSKRSGITVPSWSWMGHTGGISFMKHDPHTVKWLANEVTLPWANMKGLRLETHLVPRRDGAEGNRTRL